MRKSPIISAKKIVFSLVLATMLSLSSTCHAFFGLFGFGIPVIEPASTASQLGKTISVAVTEYKALLNKLRQVYDNKVTAGALKYLTKFENKLGEHNQLPGTKFIQEPKTLEEELGVKDLNYDEAAVKRAIYRLFLEYPSDDIIIQMNYRNKAREFYDDTVLDVYSGSRELSKYLTNDVSAKFANLRENMQRGEAGAQKAEDMNAVIYNNYIATHMTMDSIIAVVQEATALKAQLEAAKAIRDTLKPLIYENTKQCPIGNGYNGDAQGATVSYNLPVSGSVSGEYETAFAQITTPSERGEAYNPDEDMFKREDYQDRDSQGSVEFELGVDPKIEYPLYNNRYKINELDKLEPIYDNIQKAMIAHNLIKKLRSAKESFDRYNDIVRLHERSKVQLAMSDQCGVNFLSNIYVNPGQVWCGSSDCQYIDDFGVRKGITAWAIDAYDTAKAAQTNSIPESAWKIPTPKASPNPDPVTLETEPLFIDSQAPEKANVESQLTTIGGDELSDEGRKAELLPWQVGAVGIEALADNPESWGTTWDNFRIWNDVRSFYVQFIMIKYENFYTRTRSDTAEYIIHEGMRGWNIANRNNAKKKVKEEAEKARQEARAAAAAAKSAAYARAAEASRKGESYNLSGALSSIESNLQSTLAAIEEDLKKKLKAIDQEFGINNSFIPQFSPIVTDLGERGDIVDESACDAATAAGEAAKAGLYYRSNPLGSLYQQGKSVYFTSDSYLLTQIENAKKEMCPYGEDLYLGKISAAGIHASMIDALKAYYIPIIDAYGVVVYTVYPYRDYFNSHDTTAETEEYFVGSMAKVRDLKAPKAPPSSTTAPLREIFHYDNVDFDNSKPISKKQFLNHGGKIPEIWQMLLAPTTPFVEHELDLAGILDGKYLHKKAFYVLEKRQGHWCPAVKLAFGSKLAARYLTLTRGGITPCIMHNVETNEVDGPSTSYFTEPELVGVDVIEINQSPYKYMPKIIIKDGLSSNSRGVNPCVGMTRRKGFSAFDIATNKDVFYHQRSGSKFGLSFADIPSTQGRSELGVFLYAEGNNIYFREDFLELVNKINAIEGEYNGGRDIGKDRDMSDGQKNEEHMLYMTPFINNQIGGYLLSADEERQYRKAREDMEKEIADLRQDLLEEFARLGLEAPADLDLHREKDYDDCSSILNAYKGARLIDIKDGIKNTDVGDNEVLKTRIDRFQENLDAMVQDEDEMVNMGENAKGGPELAEEIATEKADLEAKKPFKDDEKEAVERALRDMSAPYCTNINDGSYTKTCPANQIMKVLDLRGK